jgi:hypothetical protein
MEATPLRQREPVALLGTFIAAIPAVLALLVAFGVDLNDEQTAAILGVLAALTGGATAVQRQQVYPARKVEEIMDAEAVIAQAERGESGHVNLYTVLVVLAIIVLVVLLARLV